MGSTGHGMYNKGGTGDGDAVSIGIAGVTNFKGQVPENSGLKKPGAGKITLKTTTDKGDTVLFQFSLNKAGTEMTIVGFKDGKPQVRSKVAVDSGRPSLDKVIANGSSGEKQNAIRMKELFAESHKIKEGQLPSIAQQLLAKKKSRGD